MIELTALADIPKIDGKFYYLASPYGHRDPDVTEQRMEDFEKIDANLSSLGHFVMSPLDKHYKLKHLNLPGTYEYWQHYCRAMLRRCNGLIVITSSGWDRAPGVWDEIEEAKKLGIPVYYV
jgi:hypothetical protein